MSTYFISYSSVDRGFVEEDLTPLLTALGIDYWYSKEDIRTGEQWERSIKGALDACDGLLLVMSPSSASSEWVKDELHWVLNNKPGKVVPILHKTCKLEEFHIRLPRLQYADFVESEKVGRNKLIGLLTNIEHQARSRIAAVSGTWQGLIHQHNMAQGLAEYPVELRINVSEKGKFSGSVTITPEDTETYFRLMGGFLYERFIQFSYHSTDPGTIQFGAAVLELVPAGNVMNGKWIGYGAISKAIVNGEVVVSKM